jgi:hypothetical protein
MDSSDDDFSDDGFDSLPPSTLLQLEQLAHQARQSQGADHASRTLQDTAFNTGTYHDNELSLKAPVLDHQGLSSEYGDMDVGELDAEVLEDADETLQDNGAEHHEASISLPVERHPVQEAIPQPQEGRYAPRNLDSAHGAFGSLSDAIEQLRARIEEVSLRNYCWKPLMADDRVAGSPN